MSPQKPEHPSNNPQQGPLPFETLNHFRETCKSFTEHLSTRHITFGQPPSMLQYRGVRSWGRARVGTHRPFDCSETDAGADAAPSGEAMDTDQPQAGQQTVDVPATGVLHRVGVYCSARLARAMCLGSAGLRTYHKSRHS